MQILGMYRLFYSCKKKKKNGGKITKAILNHFIYSFQDKVKTFQQLFTFLYRIKHLLNYEKYSSVLMTHRRYS